MMTPDQTPTPHLNLGPQIIPHQDNVTTATIILGNRVPLSGIQ